MQGVLLRGTEPTITERPEPVPAPGEVLLRPTLVGITRADLAVLDPRAAHTFTLGHEFVGVVERTEGPLRKGTRVVGSPIISCGGCALCRRGLWAHCPDRAVLGLWRRDGCLAERFTLPASNLVEVPRTLPDEAALFAGIVAGALRVAQSVRIEGKTYITVLGDGPVGLITAQVLARLNASVRLLGTHPAKFALCEKWRVKHRHVAEVGRLRDQDIVVDCTGNPGALDLALDLVRPRGTIVARSATAYVPLAGPPAHAAPGDGPRVDLTRLVAHEITLAGVDAATPPSLLREALDALAAAHADVSALITRRVRFAAAPEAFRDARAPDALRVVVTM